MKTIAVECPDQLHEQLQTLAREGWIKNPEQAALEYCAGFSIRIGRTSSERRS